MSDATDSIALLILAAGASRRLGQPKALLPVGNGLNLIQKAFATAMGAGQSEIFVVVQPGDDAIRSALEGKAAQFVPNPGWEEGMSSSIRCGIDRIRQGDPVDGVLIMLVDQPELTRDILRSMMAEFRGGQRLVACLYDNLVGVPALFGAEYLDDLASLAGDHGARDWLRSRREHVAVIPFPGGARDIDTPAESQTLDEKPQGDYR